MALYTSCSGASLPPGAAADWAVSAGVAPTPQLSGGMLGVCEAAQPQKNCTCAPCVAEWGSSGCPDLHSLLPDLVRPNMSDEAHGAGRRTRRVAPGFEGTDVYDAIYLPTEWSASSSRRYPVIVEYMGNGPWKDNIGDSSTGRPEDSNLGWGMASPPGSTYIWISMPFVSSDMGPNTTVSTYWWGCPSSNAEKSCGESYSIEPTMRYLHAALNDTFARFGGDATRVAITGWSRGAIATGAVGLHDAASSKLFAAFLPYSHLDGDCGWVDGSNASALGARWQRLAGRPMLALGECDVATAGGPWWLQHIGQSKSAAVANVEFRTTGFVNHNDAWILRNSTARSYTRAWLANALSIGE